MSENKLCLDCQKPINGRSDKKFCDDSCRNNYNNKLNSENNEVVKKINSILKKNRKIIESLIPEEGRITISEKKLIDLGFQQDYITGTHISKSGNAYRHCYEFIWFKTEGNKIFMAKR